MSDDVGAGGAFGLLISDFADRLPGDGQALMAYQVLGAALERLADDEDDDEDWPWDERFSAAWTTVFLDAFRALGIDVPDGAVLLYTGHDDERPGRTDTPPEDFVLGFGLFTKPWDFPPMAESFRQAAAWHTWVWGG